ncbi:hypothetical protein PG985_004906 [Apiospora marii]|uniref:uncharacterized protein n=1 Tax=Apiospora marii TaxID=335849 RepID=UPI00312DA195
MSSPIPPDMSYLDLSPEQALAQVNAISSTKFDKLVVGAAILRDGSEILLLRRRSDEKNYPNVYEIPGGKVESSDLTIWSTIAREVSEESSLKVSDVVRPLSMITYTTESKSGSRRVIQFSYVVKVQDTEFQVNPAEHSMGVWADKTMLSELEITTDMKILVLEALEALV